MSALANDILDDEVTNSQKRKASLIPSTSDHDSFLVHSGNFQDFMKNHDNKDQKLIENKKREVYRYQTDWLVSSVAWSNELDESFQLAISSYVEDYKNQVQLVKLAKDQNDEEIYCISTFDHPYPATKVLWLPQTTDNHRTNLLATTADYLRIWSVVRKGNSYFDCDNEHESVRENVDVKLECLLGADKGTKYCAPLTSFDWNESDRNIILTSSIDTTCAVWDIEVEKLIDKTKHMSDVTSGNQFCKLRSQIVAHNHEVYDVSFSKAGSGRDVFVSAGGDGSIRLFDLRRLTTSTVLFDANESTFTDNKALVRVACNKQDANIISAFATDSKVILMLDARKPGTPIARLGTHSDNLNSISWAPHSAHHLSSASEDCQALIWELSKLPDSVNDPLLAYRADGKINTISWSNSHSDWIAIGFENCLELLRV